MAKRAQTLQAFASLLDLPPLRGLHQRGRDRANAQYTLCFADGRRVRIGTIDALWSQAELARILAVSIGAVPPPIEPGDWRIAIGALIMHANEVEEAPGERFEDHVADWLSLYSERATRDREGALALCAPFVDEGGRLSVSVGEFTKYVRREFSEQVKSQEIQRALVDLGFERKTIAYTPKKGGRRSSRSYYRGTLEEPSTHNEAT